MSKTASARIAAVIELLCDRFPQRFSRNGRQPVKVGVYADVLAALGDGVQPRDLQSALRAYTSNARYLRALSAGAWRIDLDGNPTGTVTGYRLRIQRPGTKLPRQDRARAAGEAAEPKTKPTAAPSIAPPQTKAPAAPEARPSPRQ